MAEAAPLAGGTPPEKKKKQPSPKRHWCMTYNNPTEDGKSESEWHAFCAKYCIYAVSQRELSETGTPHIQGYFVLAEKVRLTGLKKLLGDQPHFESARRTPKENRKYCSKLETRVEGFKFEYGVMPLTAGEAIAAKWEASRKHVREGGDLEALDASIHMRYRNTWKAYAADNTPRPPPLGQLCNTWHEGKTGTGKTSYLAYKYPGHFMKNQDQWWDGYDPTNKGHEDVVIEDLDDKHKEFMTHLKKMADFYAFRADKKGSYGIIRPQRIHVTTNYSQQRLFSDEKGVLMDNEVCDPVLRRFTYYNWDFIESRPPDWYIYAKGPQAAKYRRDMELQQLDD